MTGGLVPGAGVGAQRWRGWCPGLTSSQIPSGSPSFFTLESLPHKGGWSMRLNDPLVCKIHLYVTFKRYLGTVYNCIRAIGINQGCRGTSYDSQAQLPCSMWNLPGPGIEPMYPALVGGFLTTGPPVKSLDAINILIRGLWIKMNLSSVDCGWVSSNQWKFPWRRNFQENTREFLPEFQACCYANYYLPSPTVTGENSLKSLSLSLIYTTI